MPINDKALLEIPSESQPQTSIPAPMPINDRVLPVQTVVTDPIPAPMNNNDKTLPGQTVTPSKSQPQEPIPVPMAFNDRVLPVQTVVTDPIPALMHNNDKTLPVQTVTPAKAQPQAPIPTNVKTLPVQTVTPAKDQPQAPLVGAPKKIAVALTQKKDTQQKALPARIKPIISNELAKLNTKQKNLLNELDNKINGNLKDIEKLLKKLNIDAFDFKFNGIFTKLVKRIVKDKLTEQAKFIFNIKPTPLLGALFYLTKNNEFEAVKFLINGMLPKTNIFDLTMQYSGEYRTSYDENIFNLAREADSPEMLEFFLSTPEGLEAFNKIENPWEYHLAHSLDSFKQKMITHILKKSDKQLDMDRVLKTPTYGSYDNALEIYAKLFIQRKSNIDEYQETYCKLLELAGVDHRLNQIVFERINISTMYFDYSWKNIEKFKKTVAQFVREYQLKIYDLLETTPLHKGTSMPSLIMEYLFEK